MLGAFLRINLQNEIKEGGAVKVLSFLVKLASFEPIDALRGDDHSSTSKNTTRESRR